MRRLVSTRITTVAVLCTAAGLLGCGKKTPPVANEVVAARVTALPKDNADPIWRTAPVCPVPLIPQDMVEPRLLMPSTPGVQVQAATDGVRLAFRLVWADSTKDDLPGAARFSDACAVQLPAQISADLPAPQMGETGRPVEISFWSASWQAVVDGRKADIHSLYPNAAVDHYPFEAPSISGTEQAEMATRYAPAAAVGNLMAGDGDRAVQDLIAEGPGTITAVRGGRSAGRGAWRAAAWDVVITRPVPAEFSRVGRTQVAFAVWQGARQEVGARKMRAVWTSLSIGGAR